MTLSTMVYTDIHTYMYFFRFEGDFSLSLSLLLICIENAARPGNPTTKQKRKKERKKTKKKKSESAGRDDMQRSHHAYGEKEKKTFHAKVRLLSYICV